MHTALLKGSKVGSYAILDGSLFHYTTVRGVERVFVIVYFYINLAIHQWVKVLLRKPGWMLNIRW